VVIDWRGKRRKVGSSEEVEEEENWIRTLNEEAWEVW